MHFLQEHWLWAWDWLTKQGASRATVLLMFITALYAWLTYRMARSMSLQTRAMVQPTIEMKVDSSQESPCLKGKWLAKNLGDKPIIVLDARLEGRLDAKVIHTGYKMYERHVLPPEDSLYFDFDFTEDFRNGREIWAAPLSTWYGVELVVADLSEDVVLTYTQSSYWKRLSVREGMPARVRWRVWSEPTRYFYRRMKMRIERWLKIDQFSRLQKAKEKKPAEIQIVIPKPESPPKRKRGARRM